MAGPNIELTNGQEGVPELPPPVEVPEYYTGFVQEFEQIGIELSQLYYKLQKAEKDLSRLVPTTEAPTGFWGQFLLPVPKAELPFGKEFVTQEAMERAQADFDLIAQQFQTAEWKAEVMQVLPIYMSDPQYELQNPADVLKFIAPGLDLTDADTAWLNETFGKLSHLSNVLPEGYTGDIMDAQSKVLNEILTAPKLELRGVHHLTVDEIAKSFAFSVAALPAGMTEEDVRNLLSELDLSDEELQSQRDWLSERAREWELESARMGLIRAGTILAETPELTPDEYTLMIVTQPMLATLELLQKWWDAISRPISAALTMHLPAPVAGAAHGAPLGIVGGGIAGATIGAFGGPIGIGVGAIVGGIIGAVSGAALFAAFETDTDKELTKHYEFYRSMGESAWSSYAKAFNEWDAPWWKKAILDSAYDPLNWIGWGGAVAVGRKLTTAALPRGLKWAGTRVGTLMIAFEQGYTSGADMVFKGAMHVVAAPIKSAFWLTGAGYTIPATFTQMSRNFAKKGVMDFYSVVGRTFRSSRNTLGKGLTGQDAMDTVSRCVRAVLDTPMEGNNPLVKAGADLIEFNYLDGASAAKFVKDIVGDITFDTGRLARFNSGLLDAFSGQGERITAGKMLGDMGVEATEQSVSTLATKIAKLKETVGSKAMNAVKGDKFDAVVKNIYNHLEETRYGNLHSPLTQHMQQAGRAASWHSRVADKVLYSAQLVALERRVVMPMARWQLLFTNFGPYNYAENMGRSFAGGGEIMFPKAYGGVAETNRLARGLSNAPYELTMFEKGQVRLTQAIVDPKTGHTAVFRGGKIPFVSRNVRVPEKIPFFGGKMVGKTLTIGNQKFFIGDATDWYDMWARLTADITAYDVQVHFLKSLEDIAPTEMKAIHEIVEVKTRSMLDDIASITKKDAADIRREITLELIGGGPDSLRLLADMDVTTFQLRQVSKKINQVMDNMTDVHTITKTGIRDEVLDGRMFEKGVGSIDDRMAAWVASERELNIASLANQIDAMKLETDAFIANPPKNLQEFLGDMQSITAQADSIGERIHDFRKITELRKAQLLPSDFDDFEVGSAKMLAEFMDTSETELTKMMNQLMKNAKLAGLNDVQLARLADLDSISRLEFQNVLATRTKLADIEAIIPRTPKKLRNAPFWAKQRADKSIIWEEFDTVARKLKTTRLSTSRNFLTSVDKSVYVADFVPDVVGDLTPNHLAYLYGVTGDDLYRGLTRVQHHITIRPREDFIIHTKDYASAYAAKLGKTAEQIGFTDEAIGEVYDQMWRTLGINPSILTPDHPTVLQMEEIRQELHRLYSSVKIPESDVIKWRQYFNTIADDAGETLAFKTVAAKPAALKITWKGRVSASTKTRLTDLVSSMPSDAQAILKGFEINPDLEAIARFMPDTGTMIVRSKDFTDAQFYHEFMHGIVSDAIKRGDYTMLDKFGAAAGIAIKRGVKKPLYEEGLSELFADYMTGKPIPDKVRSFFDTYYAKIAPAKVAAVGGTPDWWAKKESAMTKAREMHSLAYPTYDNANIIDESMRALFPFWCVPEDTKILTKTGWKHYSQLTIGEDVLTTNPNTLVTEWQHLQKIAEFDYDDNLMVIPAKGKDIKFTPNHRWLVINSHGDQPRIKRGYELTDASDMIPRALPHQFPTESILSPRLAAILGWVVSEGYLNTPKTQRPYFIIYQSRYNYIDEIEAATGTKAYPRSKLNDLDNMVIRVSVDDTAEIMKVYSSKDNLPAIVPQLSRDAAESMWRSMLLGEGSFGSAYNGTAVDVWIQQPGPVSEAFQMLSILLGKAITVSKRSDGLDKIYFINNRQPYQSKQCRRMSHEHYTGKVWCPVTANGTWFANFNGCILPTGNTYELFRWKWLPRTALRTPGALSNVARYMNYCVPTSYKALTRNGWRSCHELKVGEDILVCNPKVLTTHWEPIKTVNIFPARSNRPMLSLPSYGNKHILCTSEHTWIVRSKLGELSMMQAKNITDQYYSIPTITPHDDFPSMSALSPYDAAILGWLVTDGYIGHTRGGKLYGQITQKKPSFVKIIKDLVDKYSIRPDGLYVFYVSQDTMDRIADVYLGKDGLPELVSHLSKESAEAMWISMMSAEGNSKGRLAWHSWGQQPGPVLDAFTMLSHFLGYRVSIEKGNNRTCYSVHLSLRGGDKSWRRVKDCQYDGEVWCPSVASGTWIMEAEGSILPTGNSDQGYMPIPGTDLQVNPLRGTVWMGGLRSFYLRDFPEYHDVAPGIEFLDYIGRAGFFPGIHVMLPIVMFGAGGKQPQLGQLAPAWVKTGLSALRALSPEHIGAVLEVVYPDRFRDYLTMLTLGGMGYDADEIWKKKQQNIVLTEEEEKLWLKAVNKVDGIKGILMNQTGLFRIRPAEFTQIRKEMRLAIEEATGVPVSTQEWIDKTYPVTGKRFSDYFHLDVQQQALLYQWESYRRYQGVITPMYPSSWQALDIKISDYYQELDKVFTEARYHGRYEDGELTQPSIVEVNRQLVEGIIGPSQWISMRSNIQGGLSEAARILGESPAYKDVPKSFEERAILLEERGIVTPTQTPDQELLYYYFELKPELKYNWESDRMELDFDTYYAYIDILLETLSPAHGERLLQRIHNDWTPMEILYWEFSRTYARPYRNVRSIVLKEYTDEQIKTIRRFEVARGDEREQLLEVMGPDGKLISGYQSRLREARQRLRLLDSELDAWLNFFGTTDKFMSAEAKEIYEGLRKQFLIPAMIGEAK